MAVPQIRGPITYCVLQWCHPMLTVTQRRTSCSTRMITLYGDHVIKLDSGPRSHPYVISSTLYISYHIKLSFCTLSTQTYIVNAIWMLSAHVHIICLSSVTLLVYPIIHNLVFTNCLHTHTHTLYMLSLYCLQMHILCTSHFYYCYLHMYMSSAYYLRIYVSCAHYVQWSLTCFFLTDNAVDHNYLSTLTGTGY